MGDGDIDIEEALEMIDQEYFFMRKRFLIEVGIISLNIILFVLNTILSNSNWTILIGFTFALSSISSRFGNISNNLVTFFANSKQMNQSKSFIKLFLNNLTDPTEKTEFQKKLRNLALVILHKDFTDVLEELNTFVT